MTTLSTALVSDEQRQQLSEQGFFITDVLFDEATLAGVASEFERIRLEYVASLSGADDKTIEREKSRSFLSQLHRRSSICDAFCHHPTFIQMSRELIGPDADMTWNQAIIKPPTALDNSFAWHQDMYYALHSEYKDDCDMALLEASDTPSFTAWVAISRTIVDNGTLWVLPGRHREGLLQHVWSEDRSEWQGQFDTAWKVPAVLRAGQAIIFHKYLPHGSGPNVSSETRMAYQIGYSVPGVKSASSPDLVPMLRNNEAV